jgi:hypothetical protein
VDTPGRNIIFSISGGTLKVSTSRGCPWGGDIVGGCADYTAILISKNLFRVVSEVLHTSLKTVQD